MLTRQNIRMQSSTEDSKSGKNNLIICKRSHRIKFCGSACRIKAKEHADENTEHKRNDTCLPLNRIRLAAYIFNCNAYADAEKYSYRTAHKRNTCTFNKKLLPYCRRTCTERFANSDFLLPFCHCNNHDIHNADAADKKTDCGNT